MLASINQVFLSLILCCAFFSDLCTTMTVSDKKVNEIENCDELPVNILKQVHGPAFDARYMSITEPSEKDENIFDPLDTMDRKRNAGTNRPSFYITEDHTELLSDKPAWSIEWDKFNSQIGTQTRRKRSLVPIGVEAKLKRNKRENQPARSEPWQCTRVVKWINLGSDYHPSHLRTVECTQPKCYYNMYDCKPRHFSVRILQRRRGACADATSLKNYGFTGQYAEVWEWIEVTVNFCCDCVAPKKKQNLF